MTPVTLDEWLAHKEPRRREMIRILLEGSRIRRRPRDADEVAAFIRLIRARRERWERQGILRRTGPRSYELSLKDDIPGQ